MENTYSPTLLCVPSDDDEFYLYPKCVKIESQRNSMKKEEQQKLEQSIHCGNSSQPPPNGPTCLSEIQSSWVLENEGCDRARKPCVRESFCSQASNSERLLRRVLQNKQPTKIWSPENKTQNTTEDGISLNVHRQGSKTELCNLWSSTSAGKNLHVLNPFQLHQNNMEQNKIEADNALKQKSSDTPLNRNLLQRWRQYQLSQVPFSCGTCSMLSYVENEKNVFPEKVCSTESKDYYCNDHATTTEGDHNNSSSIVPTSKPLKSIQPLEIPKFLMEENTFQFSSISNRINSEMPSANLEEEMVVKMLEGQPTLRQSKQIHGVQKMSEVGNHKLQNDKNTVKASSVGSDFEEKNYQLANKQKHGAVAGGGKLPVTYIRDNSTDPECNQIFAESDFKVLENSDDDDDQKSRIHIYISAKKVQNKKFISVVDILRSMGRKSSHENITTFHIQTSIPAIIETLEKNKLDPHYGLHDSNSDISFQEAESELSTNGILDIKRYLIENTVFESSCTPIVVHNFPDIKVSFSVTREKKAFKIKFSFQKFLFGALRTQIKLLGKVMPMCQADNIVHWFDICEALNEQCDTPELVKSSIGARHMNKTHTCLLAIISKHLKVKLPKKILASIFNRKNVLLPTEGKLERVEKHTSYGRKQMQLNSYTESNLSQNTDYYKKYETYPGTISSKIVDSINFDLHNECQERYFSRSSGNENSTFLTRRTFLHIQSSGSSTGRSVRKHHLLSRGSERFHSAYLESVNHRKDMKKQMLVAKCLILLKGYCDRSSLEKMHYYNIKKIQHLMRANLRCLSYLPACSQLRFEKVNNKCSNQQISITAVKWAKNKPRKMFNIYFHGERAFPLNLRDNKEQKTSKCRHCVKTTKEIIHKMKKFLGTSNCIKADRKENFKSKELQINSHNFLSKKSLPLFDTHTKIPLTSDSEDFDQISLVNQDNSVKKLPTVQNTVTRSENIHNLPAKNKDVLILPQQSKTIMEKCSSLLLQESQRSKPEYCKAIDAYFLHLANKKEFVELPNTYLNSYLNSGNIFPTSLSGYLYITSLLPSNSFVNKDGPVGEDRRSRISLHMDKPKRLEKNHATMPYLCTSSPTVTYPYSQLQANETVYFSLQGHTETKKAVSLDPATLKHLEYVKEQEEISDEQMRVTNESQCETVVNDSIMSYSEDEAKTFIAAKEELKIHLSLMNNGCLGDIKDEYLPSENKNTYEFELKRKFDLVLEELHMFHEISKKDENHLSSVETNSHNNYSELISSEGIEENIESVSEKQTYISSPVCTIKEENIADSNKRLLNEKISIENESMEASKEYCISRLSSEELAHSPIAEGYFYSVYKKPYTWDPAFLSSTLLKEENCNLEKEGGYLGYFLSHEVTRVQPLTTCKRPIRIGLSKKARPQKLHPYLK